LSTVPLSSGRNGDALKDFENVFVAGAERGWRKSLEQVLHTWVDCVKEYAADPVLGRHYVPFSYDERAQVSFLSAAAWRSGQMAMEEFRTRKGHEKGFGRGDLVLKLGDTAVCIEAKRQRTNVEKVTSVLDRTPKRLMRARQDVAIVDLAEAEKLRRAGVVFITPSIKVGRGEALLRHRQALVDRLEKHAARPSSPLVTTTDGYQSDFWAAYLPADPEALRQAETPDKRWLGVVLVGSTVETSTGATVE